jgi:glyoxylase-like metal-dependent hydrolase (beta-lactamase superfamily II)
MQEISPGVFWWSATHPVTHGTAHSYYLADAATVLDPMVPAEALELLRERPLERVVMTNRHHYRQAADLVERFGCPVLCPAAGMHEFADDEDPQVVPYAFGDELAPGIRAFEVGAICPDDAALRIEAGDGFLAFADGLMRRGGRLRFVSDGLMGDDPGRVKRGLAASLERLSELDFDGLLFAHGEPIARGGREALRRFVAERREEAG